MVFAMKNSWKRFALVLLLMLSVSFSYAQEIRDGRSMFAGKVERDGTVRDRSNMMIGKVRNDGTVVDKRGMTIGQARDMDVRYAAVVFFFNFFGD